MTHTFFDRDLGRHNNLGALRLLFAICVILSHTFPAISDEMNEHEVLLDATDGQMDLGALAVNAFFAISGYLVTQSWLRTPRLRPFLTKRVLRIYPGFLTASLLSILIVGPYAGAAYASTLAPKELIKTVARLCVLSPPRAQGAFTGSAIPELNMPLWTIRYEFICYLLIPLILFRSLGIGRAIMLALYLLALGYHASQGVYIIRDGFHIPIIGSPVTWPRFIAYFAGGAAFMLYRDRIPFRGWLFGLCIIILCASAFVTGGFFIATASVGIYAIFYVAFQRALRLDWIGEKWDLSYGTYLYAWPIQMLLIRKLHPSMGPWSIFVIALAVTLPVAALSWVLVERPFLRKKPNPATG